MNKPECFVEFMIGHVLFGLRGNYKDDQDVQVAEYIDQAMDCIDKGFFQGAIQHLEGALEVCEREDVYNVMGIVYFFMGENEKSFECFDKALDDPTYWEAYYNVALWFHRSQMNERALEIFDEIIEVGKDLRGGILEGAYNNKACMLVEEDRYEEAIELLNSVLLLNNKRVESLVNLGNIYYKQNKLQEAKKYYEKALLVNSKCPSAYIGLGVVAFENGELEKARNLFDKSLSISNLSVVAKKNKQLLGEYN